MVEISFEALHEDFTRAILSRLPLKSLGKCICASKKLASIISTKEFNNLYVLQSMTRPRMLFMVRNIRFLDPITDFSAKGVLLCHSVYQDEKSLLSSSPQESHFFPRFEDLNYRISKPIRGLVCIREKTKVMIWNPTMKKLLTLPELKTPKEAIISNYFGYDEATQVFKVLCITKKESDGPSNGAKKEHQFFTVEPHKESWKQITCKHDHTPVTEGFCKGGVLYYGAWSNSYKSQVMSFNVSSEEFIVTELPKEVYINHDWKLVNYYGKIALVKDDHYDTRKEGVLEMWLRDETEGNWKKETPIMIPRWNGTELMTLSFKGTIGTGELVFAGYHLLEHPFSAKRSVLVLYYDKITQNFRRFKVEKKFKGYSVQTFLDHVDSLSLCED